MILVTFALIFIAVATIVPLYVLVLTSLHHPGVYGFESGRITLANYVDLIQNAGLLDIALNTFIYVIGTVCGAIVIGAAWAWITEKTDFRMRRAVKTALIVILALPSLVQGFGWILLLNPSGGWINSLLRSLLNLDVVSGPIDVYNIWAMVGISVILLVPLVYVMLTGVIRNLDATMEFPAILAGAGFYEIGRRIIIPILTPAIAAVVIYSLMVMIQVFDIPLSIGMTAGVQVFSTRIYLLSSSELGLPNYNLASAFGVLLVLFAIFLILFYQRITAIAEKFVVVGGKNYGRIRKRLGRWSVAVYVAAIIYFAAAYLPIIILFWASLQEYYQNPSLGALSSLTLSNYSELFRSRMIRKALSNTFWVVAIGASAAIVISGLIAYITRRANTWLLRAIDLLAFIPIGLPQIVLGLAVLLVYVKSPIYGTIAAIILAELSINVVFGVRTLKAGILQLSHELEDAALISGVKRGLILIRVYAPLLKTQLFDSWLIISAQIIRDVGIPLIFLTGNSVVVGSALWLIWGYPNIPLAAALSIVIVCLLVLIFVPLQLIAERGQYDA